MINVKKKILILIINCIVYQGIIKAQNFDAELVSQKTDISLLNNKLIQNHYFEIRINNRNGEKYAKISIPYSKLNQVSKIEAYIQEDNGTIIRKLKKNEIIERSSISDYSFYEDDFVKEFTLKNNTYPYTIIYSYQSFQEEFLYLGYWSPILDRKVPTYFANLTVTLPKDYVIAYSLQQVDVPIIDIFENQVHYTWKTQYTQIIEPEVYSPVLSDLLPMVTLVPKLFKFELDGSFESWRTYGDWQFKLMQELDTLPDNEKNKITALTHSIKNEKEKVRALYHYLQDATRYINISIETGGLKPHSASYVSANKYGDCKALTNYLKSMLDFVGIQSYYTKILAGDPISMIDKSFPSQQFNHVILYVPLKTDTIWLDCTSNGAFNYLGTFTQNREAFVVDKNNSHFVHTPALTPEAVHEKRTISISNDLSHKSKINFKNEYKGEMYEQLLGLEQSFNEEDKARIIRNHIVDKGFDLVDYQVFKTHRDSMKIHLSYNSYAQNIYNEYGNDIVLNNLPFSLPQFEKPMIRKLPVQIDYPIYKTDSIYYELVPGYKLVSNLSNYSLSTSYGTYNLTFDIKNNNILMVKSLLIHSGYYPVEKYPDFYKFMHDIDDLERKAHLVLTKTNP